MPKQDQSKPHYSSQKLALKVALTYTLFSLLWIYFSDRALEHLVSNTETLSLLQTYKGWLFVSITGLMIFVLIQQGLKKQHRIQDNLDRHADHLQQILHSVSHQIIQYDPNGQILFANQAAHEGYHYLNKPFPTQLSELCPTPQGLELLLLEPFQSVQQQQLNGSLQLQQLNAHGEIFIAQIDWTAIVNEHGFLESVITAIEDVSEQQKHQEQLDQAALVFNVATEGYMITDAQGKILSVNPAFTQLTGYSSEQAVGQTPKLLNSGLHEPEFYTALWEQISRIGQWQGEIINRKQNGEIQHVWQKIYALQDPNNNTKRYIATMYEINELKHQSSAGQDSLTQLPNLPQFRDRLNSLIPDSTKQHEKFCLAYIDIDNFQNINDSLGHESGDILVQQVAQRLATLIAPDDLLARQGGDEFILLGRKLDHRRTNLVFADSLLEMFKEPFVIDGQRLFITASIGLCCFPEDGACANTLLRNADTALYRAKDTGKNNYQFYTAQLTSNAIQKMEIETDLRRAVSESLEEFIVFYQPQIELDSGKIAGAEALVRWQISPERRIPPDHFIPAAENTGLIIPLGKQILRQSCLDFLCWHQKGLGLSRISVNVSMIQLLRSPFLEDVLQVLAETKMPAHCLELEVTESALMKENEQVASVLKQLQDLGIQIAIDDFGTGYSSLGRLQNLPIDRLKIDRSFMPKNAQSISDQALITSVISLANNLNLEVIAEGVETEYQAELLTKNHCQLAQGYLYSPPIPSHEFVKWVEQYNQAVML
ncbi:PAS domain S-box-containing protein/diguanylate cyclase (GGDEF) domain-containing protein [Oceanospirillum multiglobuliferum]|uniref:GGDEF domain-containing protein n=1 Tax=Oceanospirillum multiglobuliferum TaxID=64969 RepID=A0A1T4LFI7_9GAMM|nr:bifunctional diguanylate cyclase/phosphodiesterase [Oceanospirillum multiglobuliferum]OPX56680.1 hypothetical protein BTE48_01925 [Oceanospirillum multiglobuliferum]SJZ53443.1 PAS domain S-box-containing protein/diguanylate cyclase (GGDEF) domain-containing protein [Oceanospirillum multiglobuliferum]